MKIQFYVHMFVLSYIFLILFYFPIGRSADKTFINKDCVHPYLYTGVPAAADPTAEIRSGRRR